MFSFTMQIWDIHTFSSAFPEMLLAHHKRLCTTFSIMEVKKLNAFVDILPVKIMHQTTFLVC